MTTAPRGPFSARHRPSPPTIETSGPSDAGRRWCHHPDPRWAVPEAVGGARRWWVAAALTVSSRPLDRGTERPRRVPGAGHEPHERPEAPGRGSTEEVEPGHRCLEPPAEHRVPIDALDPVGELWGEEAVARHVDAITRAEEHMVCPAALAVACRDRHPVAVRRHRGDGGSDGDRDAGKPLGEPGRSRGTDRAPRH